MIAFIQKKKFWILWFIATAGLTYWFIHLFYFAEDKEHLLPGVTTHGHHQIEMECAVCHTEEKVKNIFTSSGVPTSACIDCHGEALDHFSDSHPVIKFKNPENAIYLEHLNVRDCITCHREHNQKITGEMSVTVPKDYCAHCHEDVLETYPSHKDLPFDSCSNAGCHNYHDNMALAPSYLLKGFGKQDFLNDEDKKILQTNIKQRISDEGFEFIKPLSEEDADISESLKIEISNLTKIKKDWHHSAHSIAGVNCTDCHQPNNSLKWIEKPKAEQCSTCHTHEVHDFKQGKHGMRLAHKSLEPMKTSMARIPMHEAAGHKALECNACHQTHKYDTKFAAYDSCIQCHDDEHTQNYTKSKHFKLWKNEKSGHKPLGTGVSCATCHMPKVKRGSDVIVNHDQTANLRPNEKMLREVCTDCHGLQFALNAITDPKLIKNNFSSKPTKHHEGIQWAVDSAIRRGDEKIIKMKEFLDSLEENQTK